MEAKIKALNEFLRSEDKTDSIADAFERGWDAYATQPTEIGLATNPEHPSQPSRDIPTNTEAEELATQPELKQE